MKYIDKSASQTYVLKMEITEMTGKGKNNNTRPIVQVDTLYNGLLINIY